MCLSFCLAVCMHVWRVPMYMGVCFLVHVCLLYVSKCMCACFVFLLCFCDVFVSEYRSAFVCVCVCVCTKSVGTNKMYYAYTTFIFLLSYHLIFLPPPESVWVPCLLPCQHSVTDFTCGGWILTYAFMQVWWARCQKGTFTVCICSQIHFSKWVNMR